MALPAGFTLEQPETVSASGLPPGFELEQTPNQKMQQLGANAAMITPVGAAEGVLNAVSGLGSSAVGGLRGLGKLVTGSSLDEAVNAINQTQQAGTYQPRTQQGSMVARIMGLPVEALGAITKPGGAYLDQVLGNKTPILESMGEAYPATLATVLGGVKPVQSIATTKYTGTGIASPSTALANARAAGERGYEPIVAERAAEASAADWQNSAKIEAAKAASELPHPIKLNPAMSNPTMPNKVKSIVAGNDKLNNQLSQDNLMNWANNAKADMGLHQEVPLTSEAPFKAVRDKLAKPYEDVKNIGKLNPDDLVMSALDSVSPPDIAVNAGAAPKVQSVVDNIKAKIEEGMTSAQALAEVRGLRASAQSLYDANKLGKPDPVSVAVADSHMKIANTLEQLIESNIPKNNPTLLSDFRAARKKMATTYLYQNATDFNTGLIDPNKIARQTASDTSVTGTAANLGKIAGNFPEVANVGADISAPVMTKISRAGLPGSLGFAVASGLTMNPFVGAAVGAGVGSLASMLTGKRIRSTGYQAKNAIPLDRRIQPAEAPVPTPEPQGLLGASGYVEPTPFREAPSAGPAAPNFTMGPTAEPAPYLQSLPYNPEVGRVTPQDIGNTVRVPNDKVMAEFVRAQEAARIADEKVTALAQLGSRNAKAAAAREAAVAREKLMDAVEQLQERLGARPKSSGTQGPKTRAFKRGMLTGENQ